MIIHLYNILLFQNTKERFERGFELIQNKNLYPVLNSYYDYLNQGHSEKIQYLSLLNPFTLYMINRHSYIKERCK